MPNIVASRRQEVWGSPIAHSQSPQLHLAAYATLGLDWEYRRQEVTGEELEASFASVDQTVGGLSLTMPLKEGILELVSEHRGPVDILHAANTAIRGDHGWWLDNTDWSGIDQVLTHAGGVHNQIVWLLGAGATARSALYALSQQSVRKVVLVVRDPARARASAVLAETLGLECDIALFDSLPVSEQPAWVISTVPGGNVSHPDAFAPVATCSSYLDAAYDPWPTPLAQVWSQKERPILSGLEMLTYQALAQIRGLVNGDTTAALDREDLVVGAMREAVGLAPEPTVKE
jgi:shikimate dehydrogenase